MLVKTETVLKDRKGNVREVRKRMVSGFDGRPTKLLTRDMRRALGLSTLGAILLAALHADPSWAKGTEAQEVGYRVAPIEELKPKPTIVPIDARLPNVRAVLLNSTGVAEKLPAMDATPRMQRTAFAREHVKCLDAMTVLALRIGTPPVVPGGGGSGSVVGGTTAITYRNPGMGTGIDSNGWITWGLRPGSASVFCDNSRPDDSGDGLTHATAKKTLPAAKAVWLGLGRSAQLLLAWSSTPYQDTYSSGSWQDGGGYSAAYPTLIASYNPAAPLDVSQYGRGVGPNMPRVSLVGGGGGVPILQMPIYFGGNPHNYAVAGIAWERALNVTDQGLGIMGPRQNVCYQNCRFQAVGLGVQGQGPGQGASNILYSKCSFYGSWASGGGLGVYCDWILSDFYMQDCVFYHCGWQIGASRDAATSDGGAGSIFEHDVYWWAGNLGGNFIRCLHIDSANDSLNWRGGSVGKQIFIWDAPTAMTLSSFSNSGSEAPTGVIIQVEDVAVAGAADLNSSGSLNRGWLFNGMDNTNLGSYAKNIVAFDNPNKTRGHTFAMLGTMSLLAHSYFTVENLRMHDYANTIESYGGADLDHRYNIIKNSIVDTLSHGGDPSTIQVNTVFDNVTVWDGTTYPLAITRDQLSTNICTAMNISSAGTYANRKKRITDIVIYRPDIIWAPMFMKQTLPKFGLTPIHDTLDFPDCSGIAAPSIFVYHA